MPVILLSEKSIDELGKRERDPGSSPVRLLDDRSRLNLSALTLARKSLGTVPLNALPLRSKDCRDGLEKIGSVPDNPTPV